jgi:3-phosphoshikimate 1-carboxyvinyltransferase
VSTVEHWPAPTAAGPVAGRVVLPGSKSMTNRALVLAALAGGPSTIHRPLVARDTALMADGLRALGVVIDETPAAAWVVTPAPMQGPATIDVGNAGTVMRFLPPVAALADGAVSFRGDARASERPLAPVLDALRSLGVDVEGSGVPFTVRARRRVRGGRVGIDASSSSQFVSALLLAGARFDEGVEVVHRGPPVPSQPHIAMTVAMLRDAGVAVDAASVDRWSVAPGPIAARDVTVEPDLSNAGAFLAAAMVTAGTVSVAGWPTSTTQAGDALRAIFAEMGGAAELGPAGLRLTGPDRIAGIDVDLHDVGELAPVVAAVCSLATTPSRLRGIAHLRLHETDRLAALAREITTLGGRVVEHDDGLAIEPAPLHGGVFHTYDDHRLVTAAAVVGLVVPGVLVENVSTVAKTLPGFTDLWRSLLDGRVTTSEAAT